MAVVDCHDSDRWAASHLCGSWTVSHGNSVNKYDPFDWGDRIEGRSLAQVTYTDCYLLTGFVSGLVSTCFNAATARGGIRLKQPLLKGSSSRVVEGPGAGGPGAGADVHPHTPKWSLAMSPPPVAYSSASASVLRIIRDGSLVTGRRGAPVLKCPGVSGKRELRVEPAGKRRVVNSTRRAIRGLNLIWKLCQGILTILPHSCRASRIEQSADTFRMQGMRRLKWRRRKLWEYLKVRWKEFHTRIELWRSSFQKMDGRFGPAITSFFTFIKWLMLLNIVVALIISSFIILPTAVMEEREEECLPTNQTSTSIPCCSQLYMEHNSSLAAPSAVFEVLQGSGWLDRTLLFYGYYTYTPLINGSIYYDLPVAYVFTFMSVFLLCFFTILKSGSVGFKERLIESEGQYYKFCSLVFSGWDFCLHSDKGTSAKHKALFLEMKEHIEQERREDDKKNRSRDECCRTLLTRLSMKIFVKLIFAAASSLIYFTIQFAYTELQTDDYTDEYRLLLEYMPALSIVGVNLVVPNILHYLVTLEGYSPLNTQRMVLLRNLLLRFSTICVLLVSIHSLVGCSIGPNDACVSHSCRTPLCWETFAAQQILKIVVVDFLAQIGITFFVNFPRMLLARHVRCKLTKVMCLQEFDIFKHLVDVVYIQFLVWLSSFIMPLMPALGALLLFVLFYVKKFACMVNSMPSSTTLYRVRKSTSLYLLVLLGTFFAAMGPVIFAAVTLEPSRSCGPLRGQRTYASLVESTYRSFPTWIQNGATIITSSTVAFPTLVFLWLLFYYYYILTRENRQMVIVLKKQLVLEGHDKQFLLNRLSAFIKQHQERHKPARSIDPPIANSAFVSFGEKISTDIGMIVSMNSARDAMHQISTGDLCDVLFYNKTGSVWAHSCVLAAFSPILSQMISLRLNNGDHWSIRQPMQISIHQLTMSEPESESDCLLCLSQVISYIYTGTIDIDNCHKEHVHALSEHFQNCELLAVFERYKKLSKCIEVGDTHPEDVNVNGIDLNSSGKDCEPLSRENEESKEGMATVEIKSTKTSSSEIVTITDEQTSSGDTNSKNESQTVVCDKCNYLSHDPQLVDVHSKIFHNSNYYNYETLRKDKLREHCMVKHDSELDDAKIKLKRSAEAVDISEPVQQEIILGQNGSPVRGDSEKSREDEPKEAGMDNVKTPSNRNTLLMDSKGDISIVNSDKNNSVTLRNIGNLTGSITLDEKTGILTMNNINSGSVFLNETTGELTYINLEPQKETESSSKAAVPQNEGNSNDVTFEFTKLDEFTGEIVRVASPPGADENNSTEQENDPCDMDLVNDDSLDGFDDFDELLFDVFNEGETTTDYNKTADGMVQNDVPLAVPRLDESTGLLTFDNGYQQPDMSWDNGYGNGHSSRMDDEQAYQLLLDEATGVLHI
ncbi:unnamed protein product [Nesidiocoris tenuis]|uniref:BTB domain-containing protein n=1 Tax=Nesidiocoris tenuis TaxID=355587 RepID=A0A6H5HCJ3_9HEMI|nr:unnamed protein product [Nesidiocoris tenuis]